MRKPLLMGNWKMFKTIPEAVVLAQDISTLYAHAWDAVDLVVCPPFLDIKPVKTVFEFDRTPIKLGAQNCHWEAEGAYTGEISIPMLANAGCSYCLVGHSERREYFAESNQAVNAKVSALVAAQLTAVVCVGESLAVREAGQTIEFVCAQVRAALAGLDVADMQYVVLAYEPIWAIGSGRSATPEQAEEVCAAVRATVEELFGSACADDLRILYGGSVKPENAALFVGQPNIDGGLVGGACLDAVSFKQLVEACAHV